MSKKLSLSRPLIRARGIGKRYISYDQPHHRLLQALGIKRHVKEFWALRDVDLEVWPGETIGIIGRNGAGKSTLLQMLCGLFPPTTGELEVNARVAGLLELGAGFNPEFTGLENVYFKAGLLGMTRAQVDAAMDSILAFAEIGDFVKEPVKTYSSGMFVRLAFAVAVAVKPEVLIVDEALSVGDAYFQRKCHRRIQELQEDGSTLLLVTHSTDVVERLCDRGVVIDAAHKVYDGPVRGAVTDYMKRLFGSHIANEEPNPILSNGRVETSERAAANLLTLGAEDVLSIRDGYNRDEIRVGNGKALVADAYLVGRSGVPALTPGQTVEMLVKYVCTESVNRVILGMKLRTMEGELVYSTNSFLESGELLHYDAGSVVVARWTFHAHLLPKQYLLTFGISQYDEYGQTIVVLDRRTDVMLMVVLGDTGAAQGIADLQARVNVDTMMQRVIGVL
ncbi:ABC transporter ATP-binding protein [Dyella psychrodurans]|uniref:ABC transporter ATP-binding protein n=1 Tax=Dyella psychrodurans TaxID=1927960 RepID=A0A370WXX0_9GAMM|nr:ABC transporter ATP-binding protein [Dyella psychrodurans]RDS80988.1 ABC transporter ATP-binding protein [Dyella psychrodurans]